MTADPLHGEFPAAAPGRPLWLVTLADLALLLIGFFVLLQANQSLDRRALASGLRAGFGGAPIAAAAAAGAPDALPVAAAAMSDFAAGSAALPHSADALVAWARDAVRDPRVTLTVTGATDGSAVDVDPLTGSATLLAADRARAVAARLAPVAHARLLVTTADRPGRRQVVVTLAFAGEGKRR